MDSNGPILFLTTFIVIVAAFAFYYFPQLGELLGLRKTGKEEEPKNDKEDDEIDEKDIDDVLPDEIYFEVFSYLRAEDMEPLSFVSRYWKRIVEDNRLWVSLYEELCDAEDVPILLKNRIPFRKGLSWKTQYFITAKFISADRTEKWQSWLASLTESATHGFITDHEMHVIVMTPGLKLRLSHLDDIFKGVGIKGKYPIPTILHIENGTFTVLSSSSSYYSGLCIIARDLKNSTGLIIRKTKKLVSVVLKEKCHFMEHIAMLQTVHKVSEQLLEAGY